MGDFVSNSNGDGEAQCVIGGGINCAKETPSGLDGFRSSVEGLETTATDDGILAESTPAAERTTVNTGGDAGNAGSTTVIRPSHTSEGVQGSTRIVETPRPTLTASSTVEPVAAAAASSSNGSGLSSGAVAGIAIACLIVGGALAFFAAFFLFKRRNRSRDANVNTNGYSSYADSTPELVMMQQQKGLNLGGRNSPYVQVSQTPLPAPPPAVAIQHASTTPDTTAFLPPIATEEAISRDLSALFSQIHRHVETYYRDVHASITPSMEPELEGFGAEGVDMSALLQDCSSPTIAIKHALVAYVLGITRPSKGNDDEEGETLFPAGLLAGAFDGDADGDGTSPLQALSSTCIGAQNANVDIPDTQVSTASALHRRLTIYLYNATAASRATRTWSLQSSIREAAEHFSLTFFPWAQPASSDQDKDQDLARIIAAALEKRVWLWGQPGEWAFVWEGTGRRGVLVCPGVVGRAQDGGERRVLEGVVVGT